MNLQEALGCTKCKSRMFVDRVFLSNSHLELYCLKCGKREIFHNIENFNERGQWIMKAEKARAKRTGTLI